MVQVFMSKMTFTALEIIIKLSLKKDFENESGFQLKNLHFIIVFFSASKLRIVLWKKSFSNLIFNLLFGTVYINKYQNVMGNLLNWDFLNKELKSN